MGDLNRNVWEGWTPKDFISSLKNEVHMIMTGNSWRKPFKTINELKKYLAENQPYYKKSVPEVEEYFINLYFKRSE